MPPESYLDLCDACKSIDLELGVDYDGEDYFAIIIWRGERELVLEVPFRGIDLIERASEQALSALVRRGAFRL